MNTVNPESLANEFWSGTELQEIFPRNIEQAVAMRLPLALVKLPSVTARTVRSWLKDKHVTACVPEDRRDLLGCLVAYRGFGVVFVCGGDSPEEQRLTAAHEVGHFVVDYQLPRQQVIQALGEGIEDVLDGIRKATPAERASAILSRVHLGPHIHLLPKHGLDEDSDACVGNAEERAHRLGLELVAPRQQIIKLIQKLKAQGVHNTSEVSSKLALHFGLPVDSFSNLVESRFQPRPVSFLDDALIGIRSRR